MATQYTAIEDCHLRKTPVPARLRWADFRHFPRRLCICVMGELVARVSDVRERTQAGLAAARARGRQGGRPKSLDIDKRRLVVDLYREKKLPVKKICEMMNISKPTLYVYVRETSG